MEKHKQLAALAALAAQENREFTGKVPSDTEMTDFIQGRIQGRRREEILAYLRADPVAFRDWTDSVDALESLDARAAQKDALPVLQRLRRWLSGPPARLAWGMAAAMLVLALLLVPLMQQPAVSPLEASYQSFVAQVEPARLQAVLEDFPIPAGRPLGFAPDSATAATQQAFSAGVRHGRQRLAGEATPAAQDTYFRLGQWYTLIWGVAASETVLPDTFWYQQQASFAALQQALMGGRLEQDLAEMQQALQRLPDPRPWVAYEQLAYLSRELLEKFTVQP